MKTAIDLRHKGEVIEVDADSFPFAIKGQSRFICPECGEPVVMVDKANKYFRHLNQKNAKVKECERRVESYSTKSITERLGLPLYLRKIDQSYEISLGLRPIPENIIEKGIKNSWFIKVLDGSRNTPVYRINYMNFNDSSTKYISIRSTRDSIIKIEYCNEQCEAVLKKYWSDRCDLLNIDEMIFKDGLEGGKRILPGESVLTHTNYYWLKNIDRMTTSFDGINFRRIAEIKLENKKYYLYHGSFDIESSIGVKYANLANYIRQELGVYLSDKISYVSPLWPPCVKTSEGYSYSRVCDSYLYINTNNEYPKIYNFMGDYPSPREDIVNTREKGKIYSTILNPNGNMINVDRKFVSGTFLRVEPFTQTNLHVLFRSDLIDEDVSLHDLKNSQMDICSKVEFYYINSLFNITKQIVSNQKDIVYPKDVSIIYIVSNNLVLKRFKIKESPKILLGKINDNQLYDIMKKHNNDYKVTMNSDMVKVINHLIKVCSKSRIYLTLYKQQNKIPLYVYELIKGGVVNEL